MNHAYDKGKEVGRFVQDGKMAITRRRGDGTYFVDVYPIKDSIIPAAIDDAFTALQADMAKLQSQYGETDGSEL